MQFQVARNCMRARVPNSACRDGFPVVMKARHVVTGSFIFLALLALAFVAYAWRSAIEPVEPPSRSTFDAALIARGAQLALIGNCNVCHTADGGAPYAGGRPLHTPYTRIKIGVRQFTRPPGYHH